MVPTSYPKQGSDHDGVSRCTDSLPTRTGEVSPKAAASTWPSGRRRRLPKSLGRIRADPRALRVPGLEFRPRVVRYTPRQVGPGRRPWCRLGGWVGPAISQPRSGLEFPPLRAIAPIDDPSDGRRRRCKATGRTHRHAITRRRGRSRGRHRPTSILCDSGGGSLTVAQHGSVPETAVWRRAIHQGMTAHTIGRTTDPPALSAEASAPSPAKRGPSFHEF